MLYFYIFKNYNFSTPNKPSLFRSHLLSITRQSPTFIVLKGYFWGCTQARSNEGPALILSLSLYFQYPEKKLQYLFYYQVFFFFNIRLLQNNSTLFECACCLKKSLFQNCLFWTHSHYYCVEFHIGTYVYTFQKVRILDHDQENTDQCPHLQLLFIIFERFSIFKNKTYFFVFCKSFSSIYIVLILVREVSNP